MALFDTTPHQLQQLEVINLLEKQVLQQKIGFTTVRPVQDFDNDPRVCLTAVHLLKSDLKQSIHQLIEPIKAKIGDAYFYSDKSLHTTVKNIRTISEPPKFSENDIQTATEVFERVLAQRQAFSAFYFRLLIFPSSVSLIGTTDPELDTLVLELDKELATAGVPDDKIYVNQTHFFSNVTLLRLSRNFLAVERKLIEEVSVTIEPFEYLIDSVSLVTGNATLSKRKVIQTWELNPK